ncbi:MAG TPA: histidine kinase [Gaiellaceae bacterium]|nr:histidine kinase [Gaiellaceae bacterium]
MGETPLERLRAELDDLRASQARLVGAVDARSRELERDLHDGLQQDLVALAVILQRARQLCDSNPGEAKALLEELSADLKGAIEELRRVAQRVYPPVVDGPGLVAALRAAAAGLGVPAQIDAGALVSCPPEVSAAVYFCCVDALAHAGSGARATISAARADRGLSFDVALDRGEAEWALDLAQSRIEALGGRLTVSSQPDGATRVSGTLPLS